AAPPQIRNLSSLRRFRACMVLTVTRGARPGDRDPCRTETGYQPSGGRLGTVPAMAGPLEGVRVVELGLWVAGPGAAGILADWGADVVKIEPPAGDPARSFQRTLGGDLPTNPVFELDNRSKRSVVLDLASDEGQALALELVGTADVFLTNVRPAALA